ncbi:unnamed protein product [Ectocarpus sp. 8 AP-2014]
MLSKARGLGKKDMRLHFLCPVDMTKVPCGPGGGGYRLQETRVWVKKISPVLQVSQYRCLYSWWDYTLLIYSYAGWGCTPNDHFSFLVNPYLAGVVIDHMLYVRCVFMFSVLNIGAWLLGETRASYEALKVFMDNEEHRRQKNARDGDGYIDFRDEMKRVSDGRGGWCGCGTRTFKSGWSRMPHRPDSCRALAQMLYCNPFVLHTCRITGYRQVRHGLHVGIKCCISFQP